MQPWLSLTDELNEPLDVSVLGLALAQPSGSNRLDHLARSGSGADRPTTWPVDSPGDAKL